ncbi:MAG: hypothetical protein J6S00_04895, partial [Clostridia bacterium]|nr:hypothetical protein [Clostridia bacterium]
MKVKRLSKVLAFLLAFVMVFTTLPLLAFAEPEETYIVSYGSPAILMNEMTKVNLGDIYVEMDAAGTTVPGNLITWSAEKNDGISYNAVDKTIIAYAKGTYKLTATYNGTVKNVYVMVKKENEDKFYLVNIPSLNSSSFVEEDWRIFSSINNTDVTVSDALTSGIITFDSTYVSLSHKYSETDGNLKKGSTIVYVDEIFNDFGDYTVETFASSNGAATIEGSGAGVGGRITLNEKETGFTTGILSYIRQSKVATITRINNNFGDYGPHGTAISKDAAGKYYTWQGVNDYHTVKTVYDGNRFTFYYDTETIYEYTSDPGKCTCTNANCIFKHTVPKTGYPAIVGFGAAIRAKSFYVYLNTNELAPASAVDFYNVSYAAPAIPMIVDTAVDLNYINVEMDATGTIATASEIIWDAPAQNGIYFNEETNRVSVYAAGTYKLTATADGVTKNVWVIAKEEEDEHFYLLNIPQLNNTTFVEKDWRIFGSLNNTDITVSDALTAGQLSLSSDYVEVAHKFGETEDFKKSGTLVYVNEIFKDFADYTVESSMSSNAAQTIDGVGAGVGGRVTLNESETGYTTGILSYIRQSKVAAITRINNDFGPHGNAISKESDGKYYTWHGTSDYHTIKTVYNGNKFSFHYDTETIYEYTSTPGTCTCTNANCIFKHTIPGAGYPALVGMGAVTRFESIYVYLNSNDMPDAFEAETAPEEEQITIYNVESYDPVIVMYNNTSAALENITVQLEEGGETYAATDVTWNVPDTDGLEIVNGAEG